MTDSPSQGIGIDPTSPASQREPVGGTNRLCELPWIGKINLRMDPSNKEVVHQITERLECDLPLQANTLVENETQTVYWLGPDEWLIHCDMDAVTPTLERLKTALQDTHHALTEVSDYYTVLQLQGPDALTLLSKACPLNLHPRVFKAAHCAQTRFGHASVLLHKLNHNPVFHIQVRWSYTEYVWDYLCSAMAILDT